MVKKIAEQLPPNIVVQLHNNGESLLYPRLGEAFRLFNRQITNVVTNGKLLVEKADEIIDNIDTIAISVIEVSSTDDPSIDTFPDELPGYMCGIRPFIDLRRVDLPHPLGPAINIISPGDIARLIFCIAGSLQFR